MKRLSALLLIVSAFLFCSSSRPGWPVAGQPATGDEVTVSLPVRGLAIEAPKPAGLDRFLKFIEEELVPSHFNLLILRVDWNYAYESHPELRDPDPLTRKDVKRIVDLCRRNGIRVVPQVNLLGHQSWAENTYALLR